jgi:hypothetical protein
MNNMMNLFIISFSSKSNPIRVEDISFANAYKSLQILIRSHTIFVQLSSNTSKEKLTSKKE